MKRVPSSQEEESNQIYKQARRWLKNHDPEYAKRRREYANIPELQERRKKLARMRRTRVNAIINVVNQIPLKDEDGNKYYFYQGRLIKEDFGQGKKWIVKGDKSGKIYYYPFNHDDDLANPEIDKAVNRLEESPELKEFLQKLFEGDPEAENQVRKTKQLIPTQLPIEDCYWKNLQEDQKNKLLEKIKV